ncbi:hypothetical protein QL285_023346 [Trifolium repens]|nr:hypothetical protein QL285_023346 [Trifolium repens]
MVPWCIQRSIGIEPEGRKVGLRSVWTILFGRVRMSFPLSRGGFGFAPCLFATGWNFIRPAVASLSQTALQRAQSITPLFSNLHLFRKSIKSSSARGYTTFIFSKYSSSGIFSTCTSVTSMASTIMIACGSA